MKWLVLLLSLLSAVPTILARRDGAPTNEQENACQDLMPQHGVPSQPPNMGFILFSDVIPSGNYTPGETYEVRLEATMDNFAGLFIQARTESNQDDVSSIVGLWTPLSNLAKRAECNGVNGDAITHSSAVSKRELFFNWTAPAIDMGRIHFLYSIVVAFSNIFVKLNATVERPPVTVAPATMPPQGEQGEPFLNSYGEPLGCPQNECAFYVEWRSNDRFIDFRMEGNASGWIALGISGQNSALDTANRNFSDVLVCQAEAVGSAVNVTDLFLRGGEVTPSFDSSQEGLDLTSGEITGDRIFCNFSRVQIILVGQEGQDVSLSDDNFLFFLSGNATDTVNEVPMDFNTSAVSGNVIFSPARANINRGFVVFTAPFTTLPGEGSFPTSSCSREDCDFYFRWGVNPNNPNYLTFFISADLAFGWAAIGVSRDRRMGGDDIDDIFGCSTNNNLFTGGVEVADTHNVAGGDRRNVGDNSGTDGLVSHRLGVLNGRLECTFSRLITVLPADNTSDFNLDDSYYIIIGTGENPGTPFTRHERNPEWSTSEVNLVRESSVDFDYARIPLIRTHGILMVFSWPILAWLGIAMARHMKPALPNGGWFLMHRILVVTSLFFTCVAFLLIFVAFRNTETRGLITLGDMNKTGTAHFAIGIIVVALQISNPIIAFFRCHPGDDNRWIFNNIHGVLVGTGAEILSAVNILLGLYLFGDKIADPEEFDAFYVMIALVVLFGVVDFALYIFFLLSRAFCEDRTMATESESPREMKNVASAADHPPPPPKKDPSPDHWLRWGGWITLAAIVILLGIIIIVLVSIR